MAVIGVAAILQGRVYNVGSLHRMGPGFFPVVLGSLLFLVGILVILFAKRGISPVAEKDFPSEWRGWICIAVSIVAFVILGKYGGLVPATFAVVFISAMGDRKNTVTRALILALSMVGICIVIFWCALKIQFPLFQWG